MILVVTPHLSLGGERQHLRRYQEFRDMNPELSDQSSIRPRVREHSPGSRARPRNSKSVTRPAAPGRGRSYCRPMWGQNWGGGRVFVDAHNRYPSGSVYVLVGWLSTAIVIPGR